MGKLVTKGVAELELEAEKMRLSITFKKEGNDSSYLLKYVKAQCEEFFKELNDINITPEKVTIDDIEIEKGYSSNNEYRATRMIRIETHVDTVLCSYLFQLIEKMGNNILFRMSYGLYDTEEKHSQLLEMAIEDARRQANVIAKSLGKKIVGVLAVNDKEYRPRNYARGVAVEDGVNPEIPAAFKSDTPLTDRAALPKVSLSEEIEIVWDMEEAI